MEITGYFSVTGVLMALLCSYVILGRLLGMYLFDKSGQRTRVVVQVVVLGDIARSPRMRYHAVSLADAGCTVDLIGYTRNEHSNINKQKKLIYIYRNKSWSEN